MPNLQPLPKPTGDDNRTATFSLDLSVNTRTLSGLSASERKAKNYFSVKQDGTKDGSDVVAYKKRLAILKAGLASN